MINITELLDSARQLDRSKYVDKEQEKRGNLRVGSSGVMSETGEIAGGCARKSHLRSLGIELEEPTEDKLLMFDLGYASEDIVVDKLTTVLPDSHIILREEEIPIEWLTSNGTKVTGRPDIVICTGNYDSKTISNGVVSPPEYNHSFLPILGIELKSVHSMWTMRDVLFQKKPKLSNLIQAAHYMWKLNVPYKLIYSGYSQLGQGMAGAGSGWILNMLPRPGEPMSEYVEYTYYTVEKGGSRNGKDKNSKCSEDVYWNTHESERSYSIKHLKQFEIVYDLEFDSSGRLRYKVESENEWTSTLITIKSIEDYFEFTSKMAETGNLGPRPAAVDALGGKAGYKDCDYCPLKSTCDSSESKGYSKWLEAVRKQTDNINSRRK